MLSLSNSRSKIEAALYGVGQMGPSILTQYLDGQKLSKTSATHFPLGMIRRKRKIYKVLPPPPQYFPLLICCHRFSFTIFVYPIGPFSELIERFTRVSG